MPDDRADRAFIDALIDIGIVDGLVGPAGPRVPGMPATDDGIEAEFFLAAYRYAKSWLLERGGMAGDSAPCAFVRLRAVNVELTRLGTVPIDYFKSRPDHDVSGGVYVASSDLGVVARTGAASHLDVDAWPPRSGDMGWPIARAPSSAPIGPNLSCAAPGSWGHRRPLACRSNWARPSGSHRTSWSIVSGGSTRNSPNSRVVGWCRGTRRPIGYLRIISSDALV